MKTAIALLISALIISLTSCHDNPHNRFGGPSNAKDTAANKRDTSSAGTRTDR